MPKDKVFRQLPFHIVRDLYDIYFDLDETPVTPSDLFDGLCWARNFSAITRLRQLGNRQARFVELQTHRSDAMTLRTATLVLTEMSQV